MKKTLFIQLKKPIVAGEQTSKPVSAVVFAVGGNILLAGVFLRALLYPLLHVTFIVQTGIWIFLVEFFSIFVGNIDRRAFRWRFGTILSATMFFAIIAMFAFAFGWLFLGNIYLPIIFLASTLAKIFGRKSGSQSHLVSSIPLLLGSLLVVFFIFGPEFWVRLFPFPPEFQQLAPAEWITRQERGEISGEFVDRPQTMLAWGFIYFLLAGVIEFIRFKKGNARTPVNRAWQS